MQKFVFVILLTGIKYFMRFTGEIDIEVRPDFRKLAVGKVMSTGMRTGRHRAGSSEMQQAVSRARKRNVGEVSYRNLRVAIHF